MIISLFKRKNNSTELVESKYALAKSGRELLNVEPRAVLLRKIKRLFSVTDEVWTEHYLFAIEQFAELVQEVPASEIHHHSVAGGLIDHTLEAIHAGIRVAQGYVLPPNAEPETLASSSDRWRFGAFIAILAHDVGKIVTDIEIVYRERGGGFKHWHPWFGNIPAGAEYIYRYKKRAANSKIAKSLHEKAAMSVLPRLLTEKAAKWLFDDVELLAQLFSTVTHSPFGGHAIAEIVRTADCASVAKNLGAETGLKTDHSLSVPLHEKLLVSLRKLINDGDLKRNRPGAAVWVTENETWVVSKATMEAVRAQLLNEGHKGIPKSTVRLFEILREHDLLIPNTDGESVWSAEINDFARNWRQKLTFLRFKNEVIWPTTNPQDLFDGDINVDQETTSEDVKSSLNTGSSNSDSQSTEEKRDKSALPRSKLELNQGARPAKPKRESQPEPLSGVSEAIGKKDTDAISKQTQKPLLKTDAGVSSEEAAKFWTSSRRIQEDILAKNEFIEWLLRGVAKRQIRVNEPKAAVHILEHHVALVTPTIFTSYLKLNPLKKRLYEKRAGDKRVFTLLQKELEALDIHQRGTNGQNIIPMSVEGQRKQSELMVYLLNRDCFPSFANFNPNKVMRIYL